THEQCAGPRGIRRSDPRDDRSLRRRRGGLLLVRKERFLRSGGLARQPAVCVRDFEQARLKDVLDEFPCLVQVPARRVRLVDDQHDIASEMVIRKGLLEYLFGLTAGAVLRKEGEFSILSDIVPGRGGQSGAEQKQAPTYQHQGPGAANSVSEV